MGNVMRVDTERLSRLRAAMDTAGLDALLCQLPENVLFLSGYWPMAGCTWCFFPRQGETVLIVPAIHETEARSELWDARLEVLPFGRLDSGNPYVAAGKALGAIISQAGAGVIGIESGFETMAPPWDAAEPAIIGDISRAMIQNAAGKSRLIDATRLIYKLRMRKTPMELEKLRIANEIAAFGIVAFNEAVDSGVRGVDLVACVESAVMRQGTGYKGACRVRGFAQVCTGPEETLKGYRLMLNSTTRKMAKGDLAMLELAVTADGFWCDRTRMRSAGLPEALQQKVHALLREAQAAAVAMLQPGVSAEAVDHAAREVIERAGYDHGFFHCCGHGLGFSYHETAPILEPGNKQPLESGMVITVEPGIYLPGLGGLRLEDDYAVTEGGSEYLGPADNELC